ncbi:MAG: hypothetical protein R3174_08395 [Gammaproteobacteria bacterium]|nr:hypothetical protein [Gammaproteobacteria bacterium]
MSNKLQKPRRDRRTFLKGVAAAGGATAVAVAGGAAVADVSPGKSPETEAKAPESKGYRETDHIREYYRLAQL